MTSTASHINSLNNRVDTLLKLSEANVDKISQVELQIIDWGKRITENRVGNIEARVISALGKAYLKTSYDVSQVLFHRSPGLVSTLAAIWNTIKKIYEAVNWFIETFKIKEIIRLIEIARVISPKFRAWSDRLLQGLADFADDIGVGAATFNNVLHAMQGTLVVTAGMLGKDWDWLESQYMEKTMKFTKRLEFWSDQVQKDPAAFIEDVFVHDKVDEGKTQNETWNKIWTGIEKGINWGEEALDNTKDLFNELQGLKNALPEFVKDYIPQKVWDTVGEAQRILEETIQPRFNQIEKTLSIVNSAVSQRKKEINKITDRLALPGDYLGEIDQLNDQLKALQQGKVDDISGAQYNSESDTQNRETADVFNEMQRIDEAGIPPGQAPSFMGLEPKSNPRPPGAPLEQYETWFVGDY